MNVRALLEAGETDASGQYVIGLGTSGFWREREAPTKNLAQAQRFQSYGEASARAEQDISGAVDILSIEEAGTYLQEATWKPLQTPVAAATEVELPEIPQREWETYVSLVDRIQDLEVAGPGEELDREHSKLRRELGELMSRFDVTNREFPQRGESQDMSVRKVLDDENGWSNHKCPHCQTKWDGQTTIEAEDRPGGNVGVFPKCQKCGVRTSDIALHWKEAEVELEPEEEFEGEWAGHVCDDDCRSNGCPARFSRVGESVESLKEGFMSEIDIIRQESTDRADFVRQVNQLLSRWRPAALTTVGLDIEKLADQAEQLGFGGTEEPLGEGGVREAIDELPGAEQNVCGQCGGDCSIPDPESVGRHACYHCGATGICNRKCCGGPEDTGIPPEDEERQNARAAAYFAHRPPLGETKQVKSKKLCDFYGGEEECTLEAGHKGDHVCRPVRPRPPKRVDKDRHTSESIRDLARSILDAKEWPWVEKAGKYRIRMKRTDLDRQSNRVDREIGRMAVDPKHRPAPFSRPNYKFNEPTNAFDESKLSEAALEKPVVGCTVVYNTRLKNKVDKVIRGTVTEVTGDAVIFEDHERGGKWKLNYKKIDGHFSRVAFFGESLALGVLAILDEENAVEKVLSTLRERRVGTSFDNLQKSTGIPVHALETVLKMLQLSGKAGWDGSLNGSVRLNDDEGYVHPEPEVNPKPGSSGATVFPNSMPESSTRSLLEGVSFTELEITIGEEVDIPCEIEYSYDAPYRGTRLDPPFSGAVYLDKVTRQDTGAEVTLSKEDAKTVEEKIADMMSVPDEPDMDDIGDSQVRKNIDALLG